MTSKTQLRGYRILLAKHERLEKRLKEEVVVLGKELQSRQDAVRDFETKVQGKADEQAQCRERIAAAIGGNAPLAPEDLITRGFQLEDLARQMTAAEGETEAARKLVERVQGHIADARRKISRNKTQMEMYGDLLKKAARDLEYSNDEAQDEESEEAAIARRVRLKRLADEAAREEEEQEAAHGHR